MSTDIKDTKKRPNYSDAISSALAQKPDRLRGVLSQPNALLEKLRKGRISSKS